MKWIPLILLFLAPQEETLRVAWGTVRTIDPALAVTPQDMRVAEALFGEAALTGTTKDGEREINVFLSDLKWSDGKPVKASDYRFAWLRCIDPSTGSPWAFRFRHIKNARAWHESESLSARLLQYENEGPAGRTEIAGLVSRIGSKRHGGMIREAAGSEKDERVKAALASALEESGKREDLTADSVGIKVVGDKRLTVTLEGRREGFAELMSTTPFLPVPEHVVAARHDQWTHPDHLVTCGSYAVEKWTRAVLVLKGPVTISLMSSDLAGEVWPLYERGTIDWLDRALVPPEKIEALAAAGELRSAPGSSVAFLRAGPATKPGMRRAIALAVDRAPLVKKSGPGSEETRSLAGGAEWPARDLIAAMSALAGDYPDLKVPRLRLLTWKGSSTEEIARGVREQLEESLALSVRIDLREGPAYQAALAAGDFDLAIASFAPEAGDKAGVLDLFPTGRERGEKALLDSAEAVPLLREGEWFAAKARVDAKPGMPLSAVKFRR